MTNKIDAKAEFPNLIKKLEFFKVKGDRYRSGLWVNDHLIYFTIFDKNNPARYTVNGWHDKGTYKEFRFFYYPDWEGMIDHYELNKIWKPGMPTEKFPKSPPKMSAIIAEIPEKFFEHSYREDNLNLWVSLNLKTSKDEYMTYNRENKNYKRFKFSFDKKKEAENFFLSEVNNWEKNLGISKFNENEFIKKAEKDLKNYGRKKT